VGGILNSRDYECRDLKYIVASKKTFKGEGEGATLKSPAGRMGNFKVGSEGAV